MSRDSRKFHLYKTGILCYDSEQANLPWHSYRLRRRGRYVTEQENLSGSYRCHLHGYHVI